MIKESIQEEDITIVNIYAPNIGAPKYIKQILMDIKAEIDSNNNNRGPYHTYINGQNIQRINKETLALNDTLDQMNLIDIYRTSHKKQ